MLIISVGLRVLSALFPLARLRRPEGRLSAIALFLVVWASWIFKGVFSAFLTRGRLSPRQVMPRS